MTDWLTVRHGVQALLALALAVALVRKTWSLQVRNAIDVERLRRAVRRDQVDAETALKLLWGVATDDGLSVAVEDAREQDASGLGSIDVLIKLGMTLAFALCIYELIWLAKGEHGLLGLQAGYVEDLTIGRIGIHLALALGGLVVAKTSLKRLRELARRRATILRAWRPEAPRSRRTLR